MTRIPVILTPTRDFFFYRAEGSKVAREQEKEEYSDFILKACHMIKEHKTLIQVSIDWKSGLLDMYHESQHKHYSETFIIRPSLCGSDFL